MIRCLGEHEMTYSTIRETVTMAGAEGALLKGR